MSYGPAVGYGQIPARGVEHEMYPKPSSLPPVPNAQWAERQGVVDSVKPQPAMYREMERYDKHLVHLEALVVIAGKLRDVIGEDAPNPANARKESNGLPPSSTVHLWHLKGNNEQFDYLLQELNNTLEQIAVTVSG